MEATARGHFEKSNVHICETHYPIHFMYDELNTSILCPRIL